MYGKLALIPILVLLCGSHPVQAFEVFHDPTGSGNNPGTSAPLANDGSPVPLDLYVQEAGTYFGWDLRIQAMGDAQLVSFSPADPNEMVWNPNTLPGELRANRVGPVNGQSGSQRVGTLSVLVSTGGSGSVTVTGSVYVNAALTLASVTPATLASTTACDSTLDSDGDGFNGCDDNCPFVNNPGQEDLGGVGSDAPRTELAIGASAATSTETERSPPLTEHS